MYEQKGNKLLSTPRFVGRLGLFILSALGIIGVALLIGIAGYASIAHLSWIDSLLNGSMILTGMGPVAPMVDASSKLFASAYAIFSGVVFLTSMGIVLTPVFHRVLHKFHLDQED